MCKIKIKMGGRTQVKITVAQFDLKKDLKWNSEAYFLYIIPRKHP